jgi:3-mercaptopyruvate sulfurtransferase SseA
LIDSPDHCCDLRPDLVRARQLLTPARLAALLRAGALDPGSFSGLRLFEAGCGDEAAFAEGHIGGAGYIDTLWLEAGPMWSKVADQQFEKVLLALGIEAGCTVVLYGRNNLAAARVAQLLLYAGVADVRLLDGGLAAWQRAGLPMRAGAGRRWPAVKGFGAALPLRPELLLDTAQVKTMQAAAEGVLVSTRSWAEFIGDTSGYPYIAARGEIPGALWGHAGADGDVNSMSAFHDDAGRMLPAADIARMWAAAGIVPGKRTVFYCGTGWRASLAFLYAWLMGWDDIAVYDGGWCAWSGEGGNPVVCRAAGFVLR